MNWQDLPPLAALRAFAALAQTRSFSAAGAALNVSHAAISQQVRALESRLGVQLAVREGRGMALTPEGEQLALELIRGFGIIGDSVEALSGLDAQRPLQISMTSSFATVWMMPRLHDFRTKHPEIELMLNPSPDLVDLTPGGIDAAVRFGAGDWAGLEAEMLLPTSYVIAAHRDLIAGRTITKPQDLLSLPWMQEYGTNEMTAWLRRQGIETAKHDNVTHLPGHMLIEAMKRGEAVGSTVDIYIEDEVASGDLKVLFRENRAGSGYYLVTRAGVMRPPLRAFATWLRRQAAQARA